MYTGYWEFDGYDYTVEFNPNNGDEPETQTGKVGETTPEKPEDPTKDGYKLTGWEIVDENGDPIVGEDGNPVDPFAPNFIPDENGQKITVKAQWDGDEYTVTIDPNNGDEPETQTGKVGETTPEKPEDPTKEGYKLTGWVAVDEDGNPIVDEDGNPVDPFDPNFIPDKDGQEIKVKATWEKLPESSTPVTGNGTGGGFTSADTQIDDVAVPLAGIFTRADAIGYLWEQSGSPEWALSDFADVPEDHQWAIAIGWAQDMGIALPDLDGNFRPDDLVLRSVEDIALSPEGELEQFLNRYAVYAGIELDEGKLFIALDGEWDEIIMGEDAQVIFDDFFAKLEAALASQAA